MRLSCIASGSSANCYLLENGAGDILLLDAGVKMKQLARSGRLTTFCRVVGALITHEHKDHALCVPELKKAGIEVYSPLNLLPRRRYKIGGFDVTPFACSHDVINYGYLVTDRADGKTLVYATDTAGLPPIIGAEYWLIECNYDNASWNESAGRENSSLRYLGRVRESHMSLEYLDGYFEAKNRPVKVLILCHLSEHGNADKQAILARLGRYSAITDIAQGGKEWTL